MLTQAGESGALPRKGTYYEATPRRLAGFVALSSVLHLILAAGLVLIKASLFFPPTDIAWLDLDNTLGSPLPAQSALSKSQTRPASTKKTTPPAKEPPKPNPALTSQHRTRQNETPVAMHAPRDAGIPQDASTTDTVPRDSRADDRTPASDQAPAAPFTVDQANLADLAPGDAALMLLLRMDRIRSSPYASGVRQLLQVFYDHKTILWSSGLDPLLDFDALLIATPNPYRVTETFLAARYPYKVARLKKALTRAASYKNKRVKWKRRGKSLVGEIPSPPKLPHDPRVLFLEPELVILTSPQNLSLLTAPPPQTTSSVDAGVPLLSWREELGLLGERGGSGPEGPGLVLQVINLPRLVRLPPDVPLPLTFQVTVPATDPAALEAVLVFSSATVCQSFHKVLPQYLAQAKRSLLLRLFGIVDLLDALSFRKQEDKLYVSAQLTSHQVESMLEVFRRMIPQVRVPGMPDRIPPDAGVSPPDASTRPDARSSIPDVKARMPSVKNDKGTVY